MEAHASAWVKTLPCKRLKRACDVATNLHRTEIAYAMTRTLQRFDAIQNCDPPLVGDDLGLRFDIILTPRHGVHAKFLISEESL